MIGIDLFAGAGGMSLGAIAAGIDVRFAIEKDRHAAQTYNHNHSRHEICLINGSIQNLEKVAVCTTSDSVILFGGPPCSGFSTSNQRTRSRRNPDNWLFEEYLRIVKLVLPDWVVFENVKGLLETEGGFFHRRLLKGLEELEYTATSAVLDAADYGVPQHRSRLFVIGSLGGIRFDFDTILQKTHVTVHEAIHDLPKLANGASAHWMPYRNSNPSAYAGKMRGNLSASSNHLVTRNAQHITERYKYVKQGGNWIDIPVSLMSESQAILVRARGRRACHTGLYHRLHSHRPSKVLGHYRKNLLIHPHQNRGLSVREAARLQSIPDWFEFQGSIGFQQQQVCNAVPPLLAEAVFNAIIHSEKRGS